MSSEQEQENLKESIISRDSETFGETEETTPTSVVKSSLNAAMFGMMASAMGTGIFNLPLRITEVGLLTFIIYVFVSALFSILGANMLKEIVTRLGFNSYSEASQAAMGSVLKRIAQICLVLFPWGIAVCFQVILAKFAIQLLADVVGCDLYSKREEEKYNSNGNMVRILINVVVILTNFFLICLKEINLLQKIALISIFAVFYNTIVIFILFLVGFHHDKPNLDYHGLFHINWDNVKLFIFNADFFSMHVQALASVLFCYINHQLVFPACKNVENPTPSRLRSLFMRANLGECCVYLLIGCSAYLLLVEHEDVEPIGPMVLTTITVWPMTLGKFFMIFALYVAIPLNMFPARTILFEAIGCEKNNKNHYILSVVLAASSCIIAIAFQKVNSYFGLLGGTAGVLMGGTIPAICYYKLIMSQNGDKDRTKNIAKMIFCAIVTVAAFSGAILSVIDPA